VSERKRGLGCDVLTAARERIARVFEDFPRVCVSFSGGKDSTVMLHLAADEARRRGRTFGVLFVDLEAQYRLTIEHVQALYDAYADLIEPYWIALPLSLRNAVSQFEPQWMCWDPSRRSDWVRDPPSLAVTDETRFPFFRRGMEFEDFVPAFGRWFARGQLCAILVGIRSDESLNRWRTVAHATKSRYEDLNWTTWTGGPTYNAYPIYDWRTEDLWTYHARHPDRPYNRLYDRMHRAGLSIHQARICQPYGDDQRRGLWLYHVIEPETWGRVVARVNGANQGALYVQESGNVSGMRTISKPNGHTWESYARLLLASMPSQTRDHYENKIAVFLAWYRDRGYPNGIPDDGPITDRGQPSWARICKALLRNDYWCKGLSFSQHKTGAYAKYKKLMETRRAAWGVI
jgi:predicted phosphoadenosine phosphosulfate sulfurtransferase